MRRRLFSLILALLVFTSCVMNVIAESKDTRHDRDIEQVLLGPMGATINEETLALLQWAAYFSMDCIGHNNGLDEQMNLDKLRDYGITGIPQQVSEFHYNNGKFENQHHERCTHLGWNDSDYTDISSWATVRKPLLINTFVRVFTVGPKTFWESVDFLNLFPPSVDQTVSKQCESLAAIVYYTHILGDHCYNSRTTLLDRIPLVRNHVPDSNTDLLNELKIHLEILFRSQENTSQYIGVVDEIDAIRKEWLSNVGTYDIVNDAQYVLYQSEAKKLMKILKDEVHQLLKNEPFFAKVFYPSAE